jgi:hypothetical protein
MFDSLKKAPPVSGTMSDGTRRAVEQHFLNPVKRRTDSRKLGMARKSAAALGGISNGILGSVAYSVNAKSRKKIGITPEFDSIKYKHLATSGVNRPTRNNNPLNIKASEHTKAYEGVAGLDPVPASDGGQFLVFSSPSDGFKAAERLLQTPNYQNLSLDAAMKRWSNGGYGGEIVPYMRNRYMSTLSGSELAILVKAMAKREGFNGNLI